MVMKNETCITQYEATRNRENKYGREETCTHDNQLHAINKTCIGLNIRVKQVNYIIGIPINLAPLKQRKNSGSRSAIYTAKLFLFETEQDSKIKYWWFQTTMYLNPYTVQTRQTSQRKFSTLNVTSRTILSYIRPPSQINKLRLGPSMQTITYKLIDSRIRILELFQNASPRHQRGLNLKCFMQLNHSDNLSIPTQVYNWCRNFNQIINHATSTVLPNANCNVSKVLVGEEQTSNFEKQIVWKKVPTFSYRLKCIPEVYTPVAVSAENITKIYNVTFTIRISF